MGDMGKFFITLTGPGFDEKGRQLKLYVDPMRVDLIAEMMTKDECKVSEVFLQSGTSFICLESLLEIAEKMRRIPPGL